MPSCLRTLCLLTALTFLPGGLTLARAADADQGAGAEPPRPLVVPQLPPTRPVAGEVLGINLKRGQVAQAARLGYGVIETRYLGALSLRYHRLRVPAGTTEAQALEQLNARVAPDAFERNHTYRPSQAQAQAQACEGPGCAAQRAIGWPDVTAGRCRLHTRIGMIDTAVDAELSGVAPNSLYMRRLNGAELASDPAHGSAVAALLAGRRHATPGLLPHSRLYAADVFSPGAAGASLASAVRVAEGLDWLITQRVQVINISLAGPPNALLRQAVARTLGQRVLLVAAAGNEGPHAAPAYPAAYPGVIAVTAVDEHLQLYPRANRGEHIALAAPGVAVHVPTRDGGAPQTGTSFAAPFVTAVVAMLRERGTVARADVQAALQGSAKDLGAPGHDPLYGWGLVQAPPACH
ncbi:S8 family serine peptidase [Hydrogenophaga palleronii]|uniref:S8 family serine peptidase n=1 Tax=Hydrogenophaga palleronii TaxID=65655 RepID=UPI000A965D5B|nr:S8 family serine peptidase [Hydrogenophaga palleronii]